jgi:hypothetical protein
MNKDGYDDINTEGAYNPERNTQKGELDAQKQRRRNRSFNCFS